MHLLICLIDEVILWYKRMVSCIHVFISCWVELPTIHKVLDLFAILDNF